MFAGRPLSPREQAAAASWPATGIRQARSRADETPPTSSRRRLGGCSLGALQLPSCQLAVGAKRRRWRRHICSNTKTRKECRARRTRGRRQSAGRPDGFPNAASSSPPHSSVRARRRLASALASRPCACQCVSLQVEGRAARHMDCRASPAIRFQSGERSPLPLPLRLPLTSRTRFAGCTLARRPRALQPKVRPSPLLLLLPPASC